MRVVRRKHTAPARPHLRSTDYPVESGIDTLNQRFRALRRGESLYPWSTTKLVIANGKRRWVAKQPSDYYDGSPSDRRMQ